MFRRFLRPGGKKQPTTLLWTSDIHFNFFNAVQIEDFLADIQRKEPDVVIISGDIGEAPMLEGYLAHISRELQLPIYFVLGNHDYYHGSIDKVKAAVSSFCQRDKYLNLLPDCGVVRLTDDTALLGHGSWVDGRLGDYANSTLLLNDYFVIDDFVKADTPESRLAKLHELGDQGAAYIDAQLLAAMGQYSNIIVVTHPPCFREATRHQREIADDNSLPHFSCKAVGDVLLKHCQAHPNVQVTVLCGHTHGGGDVRPLDNLRVRVSRADYQLLIEDVFTVP